jgi:hypothetical protein
MTSPPNLCKFHEDITREILKFKKKKVVILWWFNSSICKFFCSKEMARETQANQSLWFTQGP